MCSKLIDDDVNHALGEFYVRCGLFGGGVMLAPKRLERTLSPALFGGF